MRLKRSQLRVDQIFRAFSDRTRLRILHLLGGGELCVCDLVRVLRVPQPRASRHLAYLRKVGLVVARKQGLWSYYRLAAATTAFDARLLNCLNGCLADAPELSGDLQRLRRTKMTAGCCEER